MTPQYCGVISFFPNLLEGLIRAGVVFIGGIMIDVRGIHAGFALAAAFVVVVVGPLTWRFLRIVPARSHE